MRKMLQRIAQSCLEFDASELCIARRSYLCLSPKNSPDRSWLVQLTLDYTCTRLVCPTPNREPVGRLWLTNPSNPASSPHEEGRKTGTQIHIDKGEAKQSRRRVPTLDKNYYTALGSKNTMNLGSCADLNAMKASFVLLVVTCATLLNCILKLLKKGYHLERHQSCTASIHS